MYIFIVIFIIIFIVAFCAILKCKRFAAIQVKRCGLNMLFLLLALVMGLRGISVGVDTENYGNIFNSIAKVPLDDIFSGFFYDSLEVGFVLYAKLISMIWNDYQFFLLVSAFLFCYLFKRFIEHSTNNYFIASVIFISVGIYLSAFNIYRQMLAVALLSNAWICFRDKHYTAVILITLLALTFHVSAFLFIIVYVIYALRNEKRIMKLIPLMLILLYGVFDLLLGKITLYLSHYNNYLDNHKTLQEANTVMILWFIVVSLSLFFIYRPKSDSFARFVGSMTLMYIFMNIIGLQFNYFERLGLYFSPFLIIIFCNLSDIIKNRYIKDILFIGLVTCFLTYFILSTSSEQYIYVSSVTDYL